MFRLRMRAAAASVAAVLAAGLTAGASGLAQASPGPVQVALPGSAVPFTGHTPITGYLAGSQRLTVQLWLKPDIAAAERYATAVATPGSVLFHHYLSPAAYTARFGASQAGASQVESWLRGRGFTGITVDSGRAYVRATASVSVINAAFRIRLTLYQASAAVNAGHYRLRANNRPVRLPAAVAARVLGVSGLDNAGPVLPLSRETAGPARGSTPRCSHYYGQHSVSGLPEKYGSTTFPTLGCGYTAGQLRAAYGASSASTGEGQTIALVELGLTKDMFRTLADYAKANHMPAPSRQRYSQLTMGKSSCGDPFNGEEQLDVEASYDMAPQASQLVVGGDSCNNGDAGNQGLFDADTAILDGTGGRPLATIVSNSWNSGSEDQPASFSGIENGYLVRAAAQGVGMYFSSGDSPGVEMPSSDPYATAVGGTTLGIGPSGRRLFETGWSNGVYLLTKHHTWLPQLPPSGTPAAGGGPSLLWREPAYQKGVVPSALTKDPGTRGGGPARSVPDISADADAAAGGFAVGVLTFPTDGGTPTYHESDTGGTSLAAPLVAGLVTAAQQGQRAPFGFLNPVLYKLYRTDAYHRTLPITSHSPAQQRAVICPAALCQSNVLVTFDDQSPTITSQVTLPGYDNMTGLGTPNGSAFIQHLRRLAG